MGRLLRWLVFLSCLSVSCSPGAGANPVPDPAEPVRVALQAELEDFSVPGWDHRPSGPLPAAPVGGVFVPAAGPALERYRAQLTKVAGWTGGPVWHQAGTLALARPGKAAEKLGINVFFPDGPSKGTLLFVHGYMSHAANFAYTFAWYTARGWTVTTLDLPGHGMSTGPRADVDDFREYGDAVEAWWSWVRAQNWSGPRVLAAHSLGTAACLEALRRPGTPRPDRIVFCAPLLRTDWFQGVMLTEAVAGRWLGTVPETFGWDGYLDGYRIPFHWFQMLGRWLESFDVPLRLDLPLTVFSGDRDSIVDEGWNLAEYRRMVPGARIVVLPGKDHLFLSSPEDRGAFHLLLTQTVEPETADFSWTRRETLEVRLGSGATVPVSLGVWLPREPSRGTLLVVHGWRSSSDEFPTLGRWFADRGWTVTALDLPGHGQSGGDRATIAEFSDYGDAVEAWWRWVAAQGWPGEKVVVAHSLGAAAVLDALDRPEVPRPDRLVFCAPLLKTAWNDALEAGARVPGFPEARWLLALERWQRGLGPRGPAGVPLTVYQGDRDTVVDRAWNLDRLGRLFPAMKTVTLPGKDHWFAQRPGDREEFLVRLTADLGL